LLLTAGLVASLTSCAGSPFAPTCDNPAPAGGASDVVTATGAFDSQPTIDFPTPLVTKKLQRSELIPGTGRQLLDGDTAVIEFTILDGTTGEVVQQGDYDTGSVMITLGGSAIPAVSQGLRCATVGSRVAIVSSPKDAGQPTAAEGGTDDTFVFVADIVDGYPAKAAGGAQIPQAGMPSVVTAPDGTPGVTIPKQDPPAGLAINVLQAGDGPVVEDGDRVVVKYSGFLWSDGSVFDSTWTKGDAKVVELTASDTVAKGFVEAVAGEKVGSQVLVVAPPEDGFGDDGRTGVPGGSTIVYVIDILGIVG
jgi:peptidylprolyl isomerase